MNALKQVTSSLYSSLNEQEIIELLLKQLSQLFPLNQPENKEIAKALPRVLKRLEINIASVNNKYFQKENELYFNPYHSGQYLAFLYFMSNEISNSKNFELADKIYYLNKSLNAIDIYHKVKLPEKFFLEHPLGTVLGRASYSDGLFAMQGCTIGGTEKGYPSLGNELSLYSNSKIIGKCLIGNRVVMSANSYIKDLDIPDDTIVFGQYPNHTLKTNHRNTSFFNLNGK